MNQADIIMMHFEPGTKSPITLLEFGLHVNSGRLHVSCPLGFWRRGNVRIMCEQMGIIMHDSLDSLTSEVYRLVYNLACLHDDDYVI